MSATETVQDLDLEQVDIMDPKWFQDGPPHELFARMRREAPVRWNASPDGTGFWSLTKHADIEHVSKNPQIFSSYEDGIFLHPDQVVPLDLTRSLLLYMDPPEHTKYRLILQTAFTPATVRRMEDAIRLRFTKMLDEVIERGECDFVKDIAVQGPMGVLAELMGLPDEDIPQLLEWVDGIEEAQRSPEPNMAVMVFMDMAGYLWKQIERQQQEQRTDTLVARLLAAEVDGNSLNEDEILVFFGLLLFAGNDTTRNTQSHGMTEFLKRPELLAELREDPSLIPNAVEEMLRFTSVVNWFARTVKEDTELGGQQLKAGDKVVMWYTSASRDEDVFEDPDTFDLHRPKPDHKAFGGGGRHFCLGAGLARAELRIVLEEVLRRMPDLEQAGPSERIVSNWANIVSSLPIRFTPGPRELT
jgi:cholest-4-en-3-one 26-monooxygenase